MMELIAPPYITFKGIYDGIHDVIDDATDDVTKMSTERFPPECTKLEISHRSLMHHSCCDILPPFLCHILMTAIVHCQMGKIFTITKNNIVTNNR